jgi:signal transduction histidine kinase
MRTMSGSTGNPRLGLRVGLTLTLVASAALQGTGLWLALGAGSHIDGAAMAALAAGALACLACGALAATALLHRPRASPAAPPAAAPRPDTEEAAAATHSRKMEALGHLAGGVAHDFNNQLQVIRSSIEVLRRQEPQADTRRYLEMIGRSAERAGSLTRQLLAFSRRQPLELRPIDPNDLVIQLAELLRHALGERVVVETVLGAGVATVAADPGQLETALLNLAINARDAMSQVGLLTLETANAVLDGSLRPYVMIAVSDTGTGMPPEVAAHACEPFFTTKEPGFGTGLGLSQVAGFARQAGGQLRISSAPGKGTTVRLYLPGAGASLGGRPVERPEPGCALGKRPARPVRKPPQAMPLAVAAGPER